MHLTNGDLIEPFEPFALRQSHVDELGVHAFHVCEDEHSCEQKQEILIAAVKEKKIIEKLKENQLRDFKKAQAKRELKANDELVVMRFKRGDSR